MKIRTYDVFEEDPEGDRYVNLQDLLKFLSNEEFVTVDCDDLIRDLRQLYEQPKSP